MTVTTFPSAGIQALSSLVHLLGEPLWPTFPNATANFALLQGSLCSVTFSPVGLPQRTFGRLGDGANSHGHACSSLLSSWTHGCS